jgi:hypothetical protein
MSSEFVCWPCSIRVGERVREFKHNPSGASHGCGVYKQRPRPSFLSDDARQEIDRAAVTREGV